jgi:hypothetical protein
MSGIIPESEAKDILEPHHDALYRCVSMAHEGWRQKGSTMVSRPSASFRAHTMQELMVDEARQRFGDVHGVEIHDRNGAERFLLSFGGKLLVQFKKLDSDFRTHNYPTKRSVMFNSQATLPGIPNGCRVSVGYQLDATATALETVAVVCQGPYIPPWWYELGEDAPSMAMLAPGEPPPPAQVRPKSQMDFPFKQGKETG